ncbi:BTB/POZ domain-containing protein 3 [Argiope bruennichi]|uniref:BTB/POZ domain-containing protein 3 n=1 Tax=Argiope bruennichi TaxID=94029 RepID=A0A8T0F7G8_ARGBR|nr:BTB/POZ domain-containing protein 3 [Argiope bruennichi]
MMKGSGRPRTRMTKPQKIDHFRETGKLTDVNFLVGKDGLTASFQAHKLILACWSPVLEEMFCQSDQISDPIRVPDISKEGFQNLIEFLYGQNIYLTNLKIAVETYKTALKFKVKELMTQTELFICKEVTPDTVLKILQIAIKLKMRFVQEKCVSVIENHADRILSSDDFAKIPRSIFDTLLKLKLNASEMQILYAVHRWKNNNPC